MLGIHDPEVIQENRSVIALVFLISLYLLAYLFFRSSSAMGWIGLPAVFVAGYVHVLLQTESRDQEHLLSVADAVNCYEVVITRYPEEKERSWKIEAEAQRVKTDQWQTATGKIILYFSRDDFPTPPHYGDKFLVKGSPDEVEAPANPGEFDYKRFLGYRNIYHQHFLRKEDIQFLGNEPPSMFMKYAIDTRRWATALIHRHVYGERERATASALVLGVTDGLDNELRNAYSATGAMHVLAVSGLHVSILYMIIVWMLRPLKKTRAGRWIIAMVGLFLLWSYAFVTGLSPSVQRAVMMFSFLTVARATGQFANIYNTLACSAFCLLLIDPYLIMSVGFQLSYLAVLGIVFLHPRIYRLWEAPGWLGDQVWKITSVSIAAQAGTFVLGIVYFHQFPNYFILSNLLVIPASFVVLVSGVSLIAVGFIAPLAVVVGWVLTVSVKVLNGAVFFVEWLPYAVTEDIYLSPLQGVVLVAIVLSIILLLEVKRFVWLKVCFVWVILFSVLQWNHFVGSVDVRKMVVYRVYGHTAIDLMDAGRAWFVADTSLLMQDSRIDFHIAPNRLRSGISSTSVGPPFTRRLPSIEITRWQGTTIIRLTDKGFTMPEGIRPDIIIVSNNAVAGFAQFLGRYQHVRVVLDSSNRYYYASKFVEIARELGVKVHSVNHDGAFTLILEDLNQDDEIRSV